MKIKINFDDYEQFDALREQLVTIVEATGIVLIFIICLFAWVALPA